MVYFIHKLHESGIDITILLDGIYRSNSLGWVVSILETYSCLLTLQKGCCQVCLTLIYLISFTEVELAYVYHLETINNLLINHFSYCRKLKIIHMRQDRDFSMLNASNVVIPQAAIIIYGVHVIRKTSKVSKSHNKKLIL